MANVIFISPNFPTNYWQFCRELKNNGMNVLGIGDQPYDELSPELKASLNEYYKVDTLEDYLAAMEVCTSITGRADLYEQNALAVQRQAQEVIQRVRPLLEEEPVTALLIRAYSTGAKAKGMDNLAGVMLHQLGVKNLVDQHPSLLEELSMEEIIAADPDYIFVTIMGSSQQKALDALAEGIQKNPAWSSLSAVQNGRYVILPGDLFHYKPNARWGESYAYLADILCPGALEG